MAHTLLVVDDDSRIRASLVRTLASDALVVHEAPSAEYALARLRELTPDIVLSDVRMEGMDGLELLRLLRARAPDVDVILMTAYDELPLVAAAMRDGATDFLVKPLDRHQLRGTIERILADRVARARAHHRIGAVLPSPSFVGREARMVEIFKTIGHVARSRVNVVIRGESGTGKELVARAIHESSPYAAEPFVAVNCTALPATLLESELFGHVRGAFTGAAGDRKGRFAQAGRGTIFLDEIGDTSPDFQTKLLRVLQEREFYPVGTDRPERTEARVISATHRDLEQLVDAGDFRQDLYYRLRVVELTIPPLRERLSDLPALAEHLVRKASQVAGRPPLMISREALDLLLAHRWPGNVRELENCLTRAVVLATGSVIHVEHLDLPTRATALARSPADHSSAGPRLTTLDQVEREHVAQVLAAVRGHKTRAAKILGVSRPRLDRILRKLGLDNADSRTSDEDTDRED